MPQKKISILILQFSPEGRDVEAIMPLAWILKHVYKCQIQFASLFDYRYQILTKKPDILLLNNATGSIFNVNAASLAYKKNIYVATLTSEGLFREKEIDDFIWGNNALREKNWNIWFVWSKEFLKMVIKQYPQFESSMAVSGSTGLDRCKILSFLTKKQLLKKLKKPHFNYCVTYAGFSFGYFYNEKWCKTWNVPQHKINLFRSEMKKTKQLLLSAITNHPDVLFIFKVHPGEQNEHMEIEWDWNKKYPNVVVLHSEIPIADLIHASDLYCIYESTSSFEAWPLGKEVFNFYFSPKVDRYRHQARGGNILVKNIKEFSNYLQKIKKGKPLLTKNQSKQLRKKQKSIIAKNVTAIDGKNSFRTAKKLWNSYSPKMKKPFSLTEVIWAYTDHVALEFFVRFRFTRRLRKSRILTYYKNNQKMEKRLREYFPYMRKVHKIKDKTI